MTLPVAYCASIVAQRQHDRLIVCDLAGNEVVNIHRKLMTLRPTYEITRGREAVATFRKHFYRPFVDRFIVDIPGPDDLEMT
ncbi:MAG TPA: LURP-one-related family protein [Ktedonobacteraceae bacterium]|nr:LURP-one-related family protein [Ktedonobacteraceae bacterium]